MVAAMGPPGLAMHEISAFARQPLVKFRVCCGNWLKFGWVLPHDVSVLVIGISMMLVAVDISGDVFSAIFRRLLIIRPQLLTEHTSL